MRNDGRATTSPAIIREVFILMSDNYPPLRVSRRALIAGVAALPIAYRTTLKSAAAGAELPEFVIREREPQNLESDFSRLDSFITPTDQLYLRNHFAIPKLDSQSWRLKVEGAVRSPLDLTYDE